MKYIITKKGNVRTTPNSSRHSYIANKSEVRSAGRFTEKGKLQTYSHSYDFNIAPKKGDAAIIRKHLEKRRPKK